MSGIFEVLHNTTGESEGISIPCVQFDSFQKALGLFVKATRPRYISIANSKLQAQDAYGRTCYDIDFTSVFPSPGNFAFLITKEQLRGLEGLAGNTDVLLKQDASSIYVAGQSSFVMLKKYRGIIPQIPIPDLNNGQQKGETVHISGTDSLQRETRNSDWTGLLTYEGQLTGFVASSTFRLFSDQSGPDVVGKMPDQVLKANSFLKLAGSFAKLSLFSLEGQMWLRTTTNLGRSKKGGMENGIGPTITTYERLIPADPKDFRQLFSLVAPSNLSASCASV